MTLRRDYIKSLMINNSINVHKAMYLGHVSVCLIHGKLLNNQSPARKVLIKLNQIFFSQSIKIRDDM